MVAQGFAQESSETDRKVHATSLRKVHPKYPRKSTQDPHTNTHTTYLSQGGRGARYI